MKRNVLMVIFLICSLIVSPLSSLADEGMWLPDTIDKLPLGQLKKRGLELKAEEIYSTTEPSLKDAIVRISVGGGGGTGSFVSADGLILTNHHVAFGAVTAASNTEKDYIGNGFLAKSRSEEIEARNYTIYITQEFKEVTAEILSAVTPEMSHEARNQAITGKVEEIRKSREKDGIVAQVVEASGGYQYFLYTYVMSKDVRLVYAPPKSIGYYGGDPDNFEWPRHTGDFAFLRAYVAPSGQTAGYSKENIPFKPKKFLSINSAGIKEGDFTMIMGYPGATYRHRESYSVDFREHIQLPEQIATMRRQIDLLNKLGEQEPSLKLKLADHLFHLSNSLKAFEGTVKGLKRLNVVARKRADEAALVKWLDANPAMKGKYGDILPKIEELYRDLRSFVQKQTILNNLLDSGELANALEFAYGRALDREKPENERQSQYKDSALPVFKARFGQSWKERNPRSEAQALAAALGHAAELTNDQKISFIEKLFEGKTGKNRQVAESEFAINAIEKSKFTSFAEIEQLLNATAGEIRAIEDPLLKLVVQSFDEAAPLSKRTAQFNNAITKIRPEYVKAMREMKKGLYYPDANFTLRFTYGEVKGYKPRDAVSYDYQTSLHGMIEKETGKDPFEVPPRLKELYRKKEFGNYLDARLKDIPVAFITTNDITGGNSGSAVMNGRGQIIGLAFDGNYEGLGGDYYYDIDSNRTLTVDIRYVLFLVEKFAGANDLLRELQIERTKAATAGH
jgi:Peptidase S46